MSGGQTSRLAGSRLVYRRLRKPDKDGDVLFQPPSGSIAALIDDNVRRAATWDVDLGGRSLSELASQARAELLQAARQYTGQYAETSWVDSRLAERIYLVCHQPDLYHPGVWLKNFVLSELARREGAIGVHLLMDLDQVGGAALRVPTGSLDEPRVAQVAFDNEHSHGATWEDRQIADIDTFGTFGPRAAETIAPLVPSPLAEILWQPPWIDALAGSSGVSANPLLLGQCLARLRHQLEGSWGLRTLELPLSQLCRTQSYRWFLAYLFANLPRLHASYNGALREYRRIHRLRTTSQPAADLGSDGDWIEAPLWISREPDGRRRRLYVCARGDAMTLSDREHVNVTLPAAKRDNVSQLADSVGGLSGIRIRPRALLTTMFCRLLLGDLFIHGIGGAKYDQVTDCLIEDLLGIGPPAFLTVSGTRLLPVQRPRGTPADLQRIDQSLRQLRFRPEEFIDVARLGDEAEKVRRLLDEKRRWLSSPSAQAERRTRHTAITRINDALADYVSSQREPLLRQRRQIEQQLDVQKVLGSREYSFCLFSEASLRPWLLDAAANAL